MPSNTVSVPPAAPVSGSVKVLLRLEGLAVLIVAVLLYWHWQFGWLRFAWLFLLPDISMAGYLAGKRVGAIIYNAMHTYVGPLALAALALAGQSQLTPYALIWIAHIGLDRMLGFGLKYPTGFGDTHLGTLTAPALPGDNVTGK